jgi:hypothetical protein
VCGEFLKTIEKLQMGLAQSRKVAKEAKVNVIKEAC